LETTVAEPLSVLSATVRAAIPATALAPTAAETTFILCEFISYLS
jgi:hypothetical protein